jgi:hypothetical protein
MRDTSLIEMSRCLRTASHCPAITWAVPIISGRPAWVETNAPRHARHVTYFHLGVGPKKNGPGLRGLRVHAVSTHPLGLCRTRAATGMTGLVSTYHEGNNTRLQIRLGRCVFRAPRPMKSASEREIRAAILLQVHHLVTLLPSTTGACYETMRLKYTIIYVSTLQVHAALCTCTQHYLQLLSTRHVRVLYCIARCTLISLRLRYIHLAADLDGGSVRRVKVYRDHCFHRGYHPQAGGQKRCTHTA